MLSTGRAMAKPSKTAAYEDEARGVVMVTEGGARLCKNGKVTAPTPPVLRETTNLYQSENDVMKTRRNSRAYKDSIESTAKERAKARRASTKGATPPLPSLAGSANWKLDDQGRRRSARLAKIENTSLLESLESAMVMQCSKDQAFRDVAKTALKLPPRPHRKRAPKKKNDARLRCTAIAEATENVPTPVLEGTPRMRKRKRPKPTNQSSREKGTRKVKKPPQLPLVEEKENHTLVMRPFEATKFTRTVAPHDVPYMGSLLETSEYVTDIYQRLYEAEARYKLLPYTCDQDQLTSRMRETMVDWLNMVHHKFQLVPETFHLSIYIFDRYCSLAQIPHTQLQLVGVVALYIAGKYEEVQPPDVADFVYVCNKDYNSNEILDMETRVLITLQYKISAPTGYNFLQRFLLLTKASCMMSYAASYYLERALHIEEILNLRPSEVASASVCLAISHPGIDDMDENYDAQAMTSFLEEYTTFARIRIHRAAEMIVKELSEPSSTTQDRPLLCATHKKYSRARYGCVSTALRPPTLTQLAFK
ncbi:hypothetical protein ACA910_018242 [Epithemia clementina (nom. ined.)]